MRLNAECKNKSRLLKAVFLGAIILMAVTLPRAGLQAFDPFNTVTATDASPPFNLLVWQPAVPSDGDPEIFAYNVYRKVDLNAPYPQFSRNPLPLSVMEDCNAIKALMPPGSEEWELVKKAFNGGGLFLAKAKLAPIVLRKGGDVEKEPQGKKKRADDATGNRRKAGPNFQKPSISIGQIPALEPRDPCDIHKFSKTSAGFRRVLILARTRWKVASLLGLAFQDPQVAFGTTYYYEIRGVDAQGGEFVLDTDIAIQTGSPVPLPQPTAPAALAGDSRVLLHWEGPSEAVAFNVYRASSGSNNFDLINPSGLTAKVTKNLDDQFIKPDEAAVDGFLDFQRWSSSGNPVSHEVDGQSIVGPKDGVSYDYMIFGVDLLGFEGVASDTVSATPMDTTPPVIAKELKAVADDTANPGHIDIRWVKVTKDVEGHREKKIVGYRVYRRDVAVANPVGNVTLISGLIPQPGKGVTTLSYRDEHDDNTNPLRPPFGEQVFWYHIETEDKEGNRSALTTGVSAHLKDITPPASPASVEAEGFEDRIHITWDTVSELDPKGQETISGYHVYRSLCDLGVWACFNEKPGVALGRCETTFELIGYLSQADALANAAGAFWDDRTVPVESPLCYAYLVKAIDKAQNLSGTLPPDPFQEIIVCARLRDKTPPDPAIISSLRARDDAVLVEWIGPPVQDIKAYHVYRSTKEDSGYVFVGGKTVPIPPASPQVLTQPYNPQPSACQEIPLTIFEDMSVGSLLDTKADPKKVYYYKVVGVDQAGNEAKLAGAIGVSTFTYSTAHSPAPVVVVNEQIDPCALVVTWSASVPLGELEGFAVFRSNAPVGPFLQVGDTLIQVQQYIDRRVVRGNTYYYRVALVRKDGKVTLSSYAEGTVN